MISAFEWTMAGRYLKARRADGFISLIALLSLIGICFGVAILIIVMSVMNGFREDLVDRILGLNWHATVYGYNGHLENYDDLAARIAEIEGVDRVTPVVTKQVLATNAGFSTGALIRGISPEVLSGMAHVRDNIVSGSLDRFEGVDAVAVGDRLARQLGLTAGDRLTILTPTGVPTPFGNAPRTATYEIVATFEVGVFEYDNAFIYMPLEASQIFFRMEETVSALSIYVADPVNVNDYVPEIAVTLDGRGILTDWQDEHRAFFTALQVERNVMFVILVFIVLIAAFNIISSLIMLVKDKSREIAILRTIGATRASVMRVFMIVGTSVGVVGTLLGLVLGVLFVENIQEIQGFLEGTFGLELWNPEIRFLTEVPASMNMGEVTATVIVSLILAFLATIFPSLRASRLDPVEVLRHE